MGRREEDKRKKCFSLCLYLQRGLVKRSMNKNCESSLETIFFYNLFYNGVLTMCTEKNIISTSVAAQCFHVRIKNSLPFDPSATATVQLTNKGRGKMNQPQTQEKTKLCGKDINRQKDVMSSFSSSNLYSLLHPLSSYLQATIGSKRIQNYNRYGRQLCHFSTSEYDNHNNNTSEITGTNTGLRGSSSSFSLSSNSASELRNTTSLSHVDSKGKASMVDVSEKKVTTREAMAEATVNLSFETFQAVASNQMKKGDVLTVAQIAGIMGAKQTSTLIPLCHPLPLNKVDVNLELKEERNCVVIQALAKTTSNTGVEMEALTAATIAALTIYDMCKAMGHSITITNVRLIQKTGGKSDYHVTKSGEKTF